MRPVRPSVVVGSFVAVFAAVVGSGLLGCSSGSSSPSVDGGTADAAGGGATGSACSSDMQCAGTYATCRTTTSSGDVYRGGYCVSSCTISKNDPKTGANPDCPGTQGTCVGEAATGLCLVLCTAKSGNLPCRDQYLCFSATSTSSVCLPAASSECDPTRASSCPAGDGGARRACVSVGPDPVGQCNDACDVFNPACPPDTSGARNCYANMVGEGVCTTQSTHAAAGDGTPCQYLNDCDAGYACHAENGSSVCRPYCGGPNGVACKNGKQCVDFAPTVPRTTVGVCAG